MRTLSGILQDVDELIINLVNHTMLHESIRQHIRMDFLVGFENGFKFVEKNGVPARNYWDEAIKKYVKYNFYSLMEKKSHELGEFLGSLICGIKRVPKLAKTNEFKEISGFLKRNWPNFYEYLRSLL